MASMRNGSGDEYFIFFDKHRAAIKDFDHEAIMSPWNSDTATIWPGMYDRVPNVFASFLSEPAFSMGEVTFCLWRQYSDIIWRCGIDEFPDGNDPDGSEWMLRILDNDPNTYREFAQDYYETDLPLAAIQQVYDHSPLNDELVVSLNPELTVIDVSADADEIGYPRGSA